MSKPMVSISFEAYTALQAKVSELTDANALLVKHVEYLINMVTRDANEILRLKLDLSYAKAYETPASAIKFDGVAAVQAAAPAAAAEKPLGAPPAASSPKEPLGAPPAADSAATAGNGIFKTIGGLMGLGGAGAAGPPAAPPPPGCLKNYKPKTVIDAGAADGVAAKDEPKKQPNVKTECKNAEPSMVDELAAIQAKRLKNGAAMKAVNCREEKLEAVKKAENAAAITADESRTTKIDSMQGLSAAKRSAKAGTLKQQAQAKAQEQAAKKMKAALKKFAAARDDSDTGGHDSDTGEWSDSGDEGAAAPEHHSDLM